MNKLAKAIALVAVMVTFCFAFSNNSGRVIGLGILYGDDGTAYYEIFFANPVDMSGASTAWFSCLIQADANPALAAMRYASLENALRDPATTITFFAGKIVSPISNYTRVLAQRYTIQTGVLP